MAFLPYDKNVKRRYVFMFDLSYRINGHAGRGR
jgi:hypothetical protein